MRLRDVTFYREANRLRATCEVASGRLRGTIFPDGNEQELARLIRFVAGEFDAERVRVDEPFDYGSWRLQLAAKAGDFDVYEWDEKATAFAEGPAITVDFAAAQAERCRAAGVSPAPPRFDQLIAVSHGADDSDLLVQGVRYPAPDHMSGWYLTTDLFDGDVKSLRLEHVHHVLARRPMLAGFVALPPGHRFELKGQTSGVRFDPSLLAE